MERLPHLQALQQQLLTPSLPSWEYWRSPGGVLAMLVTAVVLYLTYHLKFFFFPRHRTFPKEYYPFQNTITLIRCLPRALDYILYFMMEAKKENLRAFVFNTVGVPHFVFTNDVENITYILKTNFDNFGKSGNFKPRMQGLLGDGIFNSDGRIWFAHRKTTAHLFKLSKFRTSVLDIFNTELDHVIDWVRSRGKNAFDMHNLMHRYTLETISLIAFGLKLGCITNEHVTFASDFDYCTAAINDSFVNPLWRWVRYCTPSGWKYFFCLYRINTFAQKVIDDRRALVKSGQAAHMNDLLTLYLDKGSFEGIKNEEGGVDDYIEPNDSTLRDVILNMIIAGRDTTAQALSWAVYRLCIHRDVQEKVRAEVLAVLKAAYTGVEGEENSSSSSSSGGGKSMLEEVKARRGLRPLTYDILQQLKYVEAFCMETLRLYPSVPKEAKNCFKDDVLPDGTQVRRGDIITFLPWIMGRDPDLWGPDALEFKPERFLNVAKPSPFVFTAFQAGPRSCLGQNFAMMEMKCALSRMLLCFDLTLGQDPSTVTYENSLTLPIKGGLKVLAKDLL